VTIVGQVARRALHALPLTLQDRLRVLAGRPVDPRFGRVGTTLDLYYWLVEDDIDTLVPIENYFSVFFPDLDTATTAEVRVLDRDGKHLGGTTVSVGHMAVPTVQVSSLVDKIDRPAYGNLTWHLAVPEAVRAALVEAGTPMLFWDRSYIGYAGVGGVAAFVHGVDKTEVVTETGQRRPWPMGASDSFVARPELPVRLDDYERIDVVLQNRALAARSVSLTATDEVGRVVEHCEVIPPLGVRRVEIDRAWAAGLDVGGSLRLGIEGLPTRFGRPLVMKRFAPGVFSLMHC
jgi:hypothetical protein